MLTDQRKNELGSEFILQGNGSDGALHCLELQELQFLCACAAKLKENPPEGFEQIDYDEKIKNFYRIILEKIQAGHELYVAYNQITHYPHIDNAGFGWIFSKKEFGEAAVEYYEKQSLALSLKQIRNEEIQKEFQFFYRIGMERLLLDNGQYRLTVKRSDVSAAPDYSDCAPEEVPVMNPETNFAVLQFLQILYSKDDFEEKKKFLQALEARMMHCVIQTKFLIPMKFTPGTEERKQGDAWILKEGSHVEFATMVDQKEHKVWLPVFTDWEEALKMYPIEEWQECVGSYDMILALSEQMEGFLINIKGTPLRINQKNKERFAAFRKAWEEKKNQETQIGNN